MAKLKLKRINVSGLLAAPKNLLNKSKLTIAKRINRTGDNFSFWSIFKNKDLRQKVLFTLAMLLVYRILATVPLPGMNVQIFNEVFGKNPLSNVFTMITGGRLDNPSVVAIGLGAYINASVIMQLLGTVIPKLEELNKEGERGRRVMNQYTRILAVPLNIIQAIVIYTVLRTAGNSYPQLAGLLANVTTLDIVTMVAALTAGSMVLMWLGELITEYGIGNGSSIIIATGILSIMPSLVAADFAFLQSDLALLFQKGNFNVLTNDSFKLLYAVVIGLVVLVWAIVHITEATRKIVIQYANRVRSQGGSSSYLPLKLNQAGVMPVIFASALLTFPQMIGQLLSGSSDTNGILYKIGNAINNSFLNSGRTGASGMDTFYYEALYFVLIIVFSYFYTFVTFKPSETADNLKKSAGFIPGIRPGKETEHHITYILLRLTFVGSLFLAVVALIPSLIRLMPQGASLNILRGIGGTSILIVVGVIIDTIRQMKSVSVAKSYDQFK
jgi:preprotein translocase subunit SecY